MAGTQCVSQDGKETEDTVETRDGVPTSTSRVNSCVHFFFSHKTQYNNVHTRPRAAKET